MFTNSQFNEYLPDISICFDDDQGSSHPKSAPKSDWSLKIENQFNDRTGMILLKTACEELQAAASPAEVCAIIADSVKSRAGLGTLSKLFVGS